MNGVESSSFVYDAKRSANPGKESGEIGCGWQLVDLGSNCDGETVSIYMVRERESGWFLQCKKHCTQ